MFIVKTNRFKKIAWIQPHRLHLQQKFKLWAGKFARSVKAEHCWAFSTKFWKQNVLPYYLKETFPPIIWIFNEGEGDENESRLPFKIFSTFNELVPMVERNPKSWHYPLINYLFHDLDWLIGILIGFGILLCALGWADLQLTLLSPRWLLP